MRSLPRAAVGALLAALVLTGCSDSDDEPKEPVAGQQPSSAAPSTPAPADPTPTAASPTASPSPVSLTDRLLAPADVPGFNTRWVWQDGETGSAGSEPFGLCAKVDLVSIGATEVVQRTYFPPVDTDDNAAEQIAEFPDATTTATALKVLKSWQQRCATKRLKVGPLTDVPGGSWYLVTRTSANPDEGLFQAVGLVTSGTRIAVLTMDLVGQDYGYRAGTGPMVGMVAAAADLLAR